MLNHPLARTSLLLSLFSLPLACTDDLASTSDSEPFAGEDTSSDTEGGDGDDGGDGDNGGESGGDDAVGDGDGDGGDGDGDALPGDGDGDDPPGDGDGDDPPGDGDGDGFPGDGDGDGFPGDGDGDDLPGDGDGDDLPGDGDGDNGDACQESDGVLYPVPPSVMFLLDRSGSMNFEGFDQNDADKSRWQALYESVEAVVSDGADATIAFGAKTFSTWNFGECGVSDTADVPIALDNGGGVLAGIPGPLAEIIGGTPTNLALEQTLAIMQAHDSGGGSKIVFLITDGAIGCRDSPEAALADAIEELDDHLANDEITTYVVGIAPSNSNMVLTQLNQMALAGGAPKAGPESFYRADDAQELSDALATVVADSVGKSCVMDLEEAPIFPDYTKVVIGDTQYPLIDDCDSEDGFVYTTMDFTQVRVCGQACEELAVENSALVQFFCVPG